MTFHNQALDCRIELYAQTVYPDPKVPDIRLDICLGEDSMPATRLILDAKYKDYRITPMSLSADLDINSNDGIVNKYYRSNTQAGKIPAHRVFVLHPSKTLGQQNSTRRQQWSTVSSFGGGRIFKWEDSACNHRWGGVQLRPGSSEDSLHLLLAMTLQLTEGIPRFCIVCGTMLTAEAVEEKTTKSDYQKYWCTCPTCGHFFVKTHCQKCHQPLYKHLLDWTYHDLHDTQEGNARCPSCEFLL